FQAEDGIRDYKVTGVQTCALPISRRPIPADRQLGAGRGLDPVRQPDRPGARYPLALDAHRDAQLGNGGYPEQPADEVALRDPWQIGRASCRERGAISETAGAASRT